MVQRIKNVQNRSGETRAALLKAVAALWEDRPFDAITVADIAAKAGVAKGTVLAHFSEKLSILAQFLADAIARTRAQLEAQPDFARTPDKLTAAMLPLLDYLLHDKALLRLLTTDGDGAQCAAVLDPALAELRDTLSRGFATAELTDPELCADVLLALSVQVVVSGHVTTPEAARVALTRLVSILYR
jgi:AcrR family transcriptional regulator